MEAKSIYDEIGKQISELRQSAKLTQSELAQKIGVKQGFIGSIEKGEKLSLARLQQILDALGYEFTFQEKKNSVDFSIEIRKLEEIETLIADINGDAIQEKRGVWNQLKRTLKDALQLHIEIADAMRDDAERWEEERRLESPAGGQEHRDQCQQHG